MTEVRKVAMGNEVSNKWPASLNLSWFTLIVVFGGLIQFAVDLSGVSFPVQVLARLLLVASAIPVFLVGHGQRGGLAPSSVRLAATLLFFSAIISFIKDSVESSDASDATLSFLFMYSVGSLLIFAAVLPLSARYGGSFYALTAVSIAFGLLQLFSQRLHLPSDYLETVGLLYENFVNGRLRVVSFFRAAPRFAEFLTIVSLALLYQILIPSSARLARSRGFLLLTYGIVVVLLFNTYSRAGYLLFLSSTILMAILIRNSVRQGRGLGRLGPFLLLATGGVATAVVALDKLPFDITILDTTSLQSRRNSWSRLFELIGEGSVWDILFGFGVAARFARGDVGYFIVDNVALALFLYSGAIGILTALFITAAAVWFAVSVRRMGARTLEPWIAFIPCLWIEGIFVDNHNTLFLSILAMLGFVSSVRSGNKLKDDQPTYARTP